MQLVKPSFEIIEQKPGIDGLFRHMELCARTCYKSEDKITEESARKFINNVIVARGHTAMVEHGTVYLHVHTEYTKEMFDNHIPDPLGGIVAKYTTNKYSDVNQTSNNTKDTVIWDWNKPIIIDYYITTNYRVLLQNDWLDDLKYQCEPTEHHVKRVTVKFVCDRGVSHEYVRHRVFSFAQESTRYCNYSKDKFGKECTFIIPAWFDKYMNEDYSDYHTLDWQAGLDSSCAETNWLYAMLFAEKSYFSSLENGMIAQQARAVLPNSLKTELIMTGTTKQWEGFFELRDANSAHPQARELAKPLHEEFIRRGLLT